jgi:hypothetical protein
MFYRRLCAIFALFLLTLPLQAQEAHSMAIGGAATAAPMGIFGIYWNPSMLGVPDGSPSGWSIGSGFSAFDTSNSGQPILHFQPSDGLQSTQDPIQRYQQYLGIFAVKYYGTAGGVVYDQELNYLASQGALQFFNDRANGTLSTSPYNLNFQQTNQQVANLVLSYGVPLPLGSLPMLTVGGSLKYHDGLWYNQTTLTGTYTQSNPGNGGYTYTKTSSTSGLGLSIDAGFLAKLTDSLTVGMMFENLTSNFTWQATQQNYQLDGNGNESPLGPSQSVTVSSPFPYATKLGAVFTPQGNSVGVEGQVAWSQQQTRWSVGLERFYPQSHLLVRLGTFADEISNQQLWCFGIGYVTKIAVIDASFLTRSIPNLQDSIALGGALDAVVTF